MLTPNRVTKITSVQEIEAYARSDPYNKNGLVCKWCILRPDPFPSDLSCL